jgi:Meiotically Up-regulated Gene 113 (MUG113) protein
MQAYGTKEKPGCGGTRQIRRNKGGQSASGYTQRRKAEGNCDKGGDRGSQSALGKEREECKGYIYFAEDKKRRVIKIGFTRVPKRRLIALNQTSDAWLGCRMRFITITPGTPYLEDQVLNKFQRYQIKTEHGYEWFHHEPAILIAALSMPRVSPVLFGLCTHGTIPCNRCIDKRLEKYDDPQMWLFEDQG